MDFINTNTYTKDNLLFVEIDSNEKTNRKGQDIIAVVDTSGSMIESATIKTNDGVENNGFCVLDIVKHSLNTILESLTSIDRFSLITFDTVGKVISNLNYVTKDYREEIKNKIKLLKPSGTTNLWDGLLRGMNQIKENSNGNNSSIILLTDGIPNVEPPRGHEETFKKYLEKNKIKFNLYTCGFGNNMYSNLLNNLSNIAPLEGTFSFIPDSGMVGTIFINLLSNIFCQRINNIKIYDNDKCINTKSFSVGTSKRTLIIKYNKDNIDNLKISGTHLTFGPFEIKLENNKIIDLEEFNFNLVRYKLIEFIESNLKSRTNNNFSDNIKDIPLNDKINKLLEDYQGEISMAFTDKYFDSWGKHYLYSVKHAHEKEYCNNFKDPGVQIYKDETFEKYQDKIEDIFTNLPPPEPIVRTTSFNNNFSMGTYYMSSNPCYAPECLVTLNDNSKMSVGDLKKGMMVKTRNGPAEIKLVIVSRVKNHETLMCHFDSGLIISPYHPIIYNGKWTYPCEVVKPIKTRTPVIISVVLDKHHYLTVNNIETTTMGHNHKDDKVKHEFFGSGKVLECLKNHPTFEKGMVELPEDGVIRDKNTFKIIGFNF